ncbi:hypothetical protein IGI04_009511 [Brassica rapa subsp. trilocularis]|uniref:BnaAnng32180D protein n=3 Tax=Brassica TaxID=3705 RepID=A0A078JU43_BRANA|nr:hypothetical protein IGI04_009511 [Brassica rapa subsp. trilocularis]CDY69970.1 BnaAnng32180D [Brassica napus]
MSVGQEKEPMAQVYQLQKKPIMKTQQDEASTVVLGSNKTPRSCARSTEKQPLQLHNKYAALTIASY